MKPLYNLTQNMKSTYFSLILFDIQKKIDERCSNWVTEVFVDKKEYLSESLLTSNLKLDLEYLISQLIWMFELAIENGFEVADHREHIENLYKVYTESENGFRSIVMDNRYNRNEHRLYTTQEIKELNENIDKLMRNIIDEFKS